MHEYKLIGYPFYYLIMHLISFTSIVENAFLVDSCGYKGSEYMYFRNNISVSGLRNFVD